MLMSLFDFRFGLEFISVLFFLKQDLIILVRLKDS